MFYVLRSGCSWRMLCPKSIRRGRRSTTTFRKWRIDGRLRRAHDRLGEAAIYESEGGHRDPSAAVIDSQVLKTTPVGGAQRGATRRSEASRRTKAPHPGGHGRAGVGHEGPPRRAARPGRRQTIARCEGEELAKVGVLWAEGAYTGGFREWLGRRLWGGLWKCPITPTGSCGATA